MDPKPNKFDNLFDQLSENRKLAEQVRERTMEGVKELVGLKKVYHEKQREQLELELEVSQLKSANHNLLMTMVNSLIEKEESNTKIKNYYSGIERLKAHIENMEKELDSMKEGERVNRFCERNSIPNQLVVLNKIKDAKFKLIESGFPPTKI